MGENGTLITAFAQTVQVRKNVSCIPSEGEPKKIRGYVITWNLRVTGTLIYEAAKYEVVFH